MIQSFLLLAICAGFGRAQDTETNMQCVERLEMPVYPPLAAQARISGTVAAVVTIASDGPVKTKTEGKQYFISTVETAIRVATFSKACTGKSVTPVFDFQAGLDLRRHQALAYPNRFSIISAARLVQP